VVRAEQSLQSTFIKGRVYKLLTYVQSWLDSVICRSFASQVSRNVMMF